MRPACAHRRFQRQIDESEHGSVEQPIAGGAVKQHRDVGGRYRMYVPDPAGDEKQTAYRSNPESAVPIDAPEFPVAAGAKERDDAVASAEECAREKAAVFRE